MHLLADEDVTPELAGDLMLVDREDGERLTVSVTEDILETFAKRVSDWKEQVRSRTLGVGGAYIPLTPASDIEDLLLTSWRESGVLR
jgi:hypothetical protein